MSLYKKLEKKHVDLVYYTESIRKLFFRLLKNNPDWNNQLLCSNDIFDTTPLFIVVSTTKGLCGSLNSNLFRYIKNSVFIEEQQSPMFITIGKKAKKFVSTE